VAQGLGRICSLFFDLSRVMSTRLSKEQSNGRLLLGTHGGEHGEMGRI